MVWLGNIIFLVQQTKLDLYITKIRCTMGAFLKSLCYVSNITTIVHENQLLAKNGEEEKRRSLFTSVSTGSEF